MSPVTLIVMLFVTLFAFMAQSACQAEPTLGDKKLVLADKGRALVTIVLPETKPGVDGKLLTDPDSYKNTLDTAGYMVASRRVESGQIHRMAADDLSTYLGKVSGAKFSVVADAESVSGRTIQIGLTRKARSCNFKLDDLKWDGYLITARGDDIFILGRTDEGTANGVYGFLRDNIGVRWYMPGELWEVVPEARTIAVNVTETKSNPSFEYRNWTRIFDQKWEMRNRTQGEYFGALYFPFNHNLMRILPVSKYAEEHSEYYAFVDGKRLIPEKDGEQIGQPCFTNPDVRKIAVRAAEDFFKAHPEATTYSLAMNDDYRFCTCPACTALDDPVVEYEGYSIHSDSYFQFVCEVAKEIEKSCPGKSIGVYAYENVVLPPKHIDRLPGNVVVMLTQDTSQYHDPAYMERDRKLLLEWSKRTDRLIKYDYYGLGWFTPRYFPHIAAEDIKFSREHHVIGQYNEVYSFWANMGPLLYMGAQLLWNADQNPDDLLNEYFVGLFGDVAPEMKEFYSILEKQWMNERKGQWFEGILDMKTQVGIFDPAAMDDAMKCLDTARKKSSGKVRSRVENIRDHFNFSYLLVKGYQRAESLNTLPLNTREDAERSIGEMAKVLNTANQAKSVYESTIMNDPYYKHPSYATDSYYFWYKFDKWESLLTGRVNERLIAVNDWARANMGNECESFLAQSRDRLAKIKLRQPIKL